MIRRCEKHAPKHAAVADHAKKHVARERLSLAILAFSSDTLITVTETHMIWLHLTTPVILLSKDLIEIIKAD